MRIVDLPHASLGFDCWSSVTAAQYAAMRALGFRHAMRYVDDLTPGEIADCLAADLRLVPVQGSRKPGWMPDSIKGGDDGARARRQAIALGIPVGVNIICDLETPDTTATTGAIAAYAKSWCAELVAGGYLPKVYVGYGIPLDAAALYELPFVGYVRSFSGGVSDVTCGWQMYQLFHHPTGECVVADIYPDAPIVVSQMRIDALITQSDHKGRRINAVAV